MKLKNKFVIYSVIIHLIFIFLVLQFIKADQYLFIAGEVLIVISFFVSLWLYRGISHPFNLISSGIESIKDKDFNTRMIPVGHKEMDDLIAVYNQMIDRLREERIRQSEKNHFLDKLIQASPSGIIMLDSKGKITSVNAAASRMLDLNSKNNTEINLRDVPGKLASEINLLKDGASEVINVNGAQVYKCQKAHFVDLGYSHHFVMIEELTDEIYKKEKSAFEKVIRMMSHETNNSIGAINSILNTFINYSSQLEPDYREDYENALSVAVNRNKALSNVMSNFAKVVKIPEPVKHEADLNQVLRSVQLVMDAEGKKKNIIWDWSLGAINQSVMIDVEQMEQVLINILKNSIEAVSDNGQIVIKTTNNPLSISISDNGSGISPEASQKIFSPFFSTKKNGQGIGLTIIREVLLNHGFKFSLNSEAGWTEFLIVLD
jgi:two-component system nitrogen regulation sensor histidine kinase NtrY